MVIRDISEATELSALTEEVQKGHEVVIAEAGKPVARRVAYRGLAAPRAPASMAGQMRIASDFETLSWPAWMD